MSNPRIELEIGQGDADWGRIVLELDAERAPQTVENFLAYVDAKFFDGTIFHRVIPNFMIQGGGYAAAGQLKDKGRREPIENEAAQGLRNERGAIAMARTSDPHSATSQFFINVQDNEMLDHPGTDGWGYCAFGQVVEGLEIVDRIKDVETIGNPQMGERSQPKHPPRIKTARRVPE
jgi:peptidyl-prolyl cis-trans isomerase B (cyclophilin B)